MTCTPFKHNHMMQLFNLQNIMPFSLHGGLRLTVWQIKVVAVTHISESGAHCYAHATADLTVVLILKAMGLANWEVLPTKVPSTLPVWILLILAVMSSEPVMATVESALMSNDVKPASQRQKLLSRTLPNM